MTERTEFGYSRSVCACGGCQMNCRYMPGFLIPADLQRMIPKDADPFAWAIDNLLASPGAMAMKDGETFRIPTLVSATRADGSCKHMENGSCNIHAVAPFGCAFFSCTMAKSRDNTLSRLGLEAVYNAWIESALYAKIWVHLAYNGKTQLAPEILRERMAQELCLYRRP